VHPANAPAAHQPLAGLLRLPPWRQQHGEDQVRPAAGHRGPLLAARGGLPGHPLCLAPGGQSQVSRVELSLVESRLGVAQDYASPGGRLRQSENFLGSAVSVTLTWATAWAAQVECVVVF